MSQDYDTTLADCLGGGSLRQDALAWYEGVARVANPPTAPVLDAAAWLDDEVGLDERRRQVLARILLDEMVSAGGASRPGLSGLADLQPDADAGASDKPETEVQACWPGIWLTSLRDSSDVGAAIRRQADANLEEAGLPAISSVTLQPADGARVKEALALGREVMPAVFDSTLPLVHEVVVHDSPIVSMQLPRTPEMVYINDDFRKAPLGVVADRVLHEALHEKSALMARTRFLMRAGYEETASPTVLLPWSQDDPKPRHFTAWRLLSACHVYTHLSVFWDRLDPGSSLRGTYRYRADFMLGALSCSGFVFELGVDGRELCTLMRNCVDSLR